MTYVLILYYIQTAPHIDTLQCITYIEMYSLHILGTMNILYTAIRVHIVCYIPTFLGASI